MQVGMVVLSFWIYFSQLFGRGWVECVEYISLCIIVRMLQIVSSAKTSKHYPRLPFKTTEKEKKVNRSMLNSFSNLYFSFRTPVAQLHTINLREKTAYFTIYFQHPAVTLGFAASCWKWSFVGPFTLLKPSCSCPLAPPMEKGGSVVCKNFARALVSEVSQREIRWRWSNVFLYDCEKLIMQVSTWWSRLNCYHLCS